LPDYLSPDNSPRAENPSLAGIKHLNRLDNVLARAEWQDDSAAEGLMLNQAGNLIEATASNIFIVRNRELLTPELSRAGVAGVTRRIICEQLAPAMKLAIIETRLSIHDLEGADEVFICNSINGIWPVTRLLDHTPGVFPVGEYTRQLQVALDDFILQKSLQAGAAQ
jgi:4-amino-4-deoxychorismate lyase